MRIKNKEIRRRRQRKEQTIKDAQRELRIKFGDKKTAPAPAEKPAATKKAAPKKTADAGAEKKPAAKKPAAKKAEPKKEAAEPAAE
jgi:hypothetical protein